MLSKSWIQFPVDEQGYVPSLLFDLRPNYGGGNEDNGDLLQKLPGTHCHTQCPQPCRRPPLTHSSAGDSWTFTVSSGSVSCGVTAPFSWVLVVQGLFVPSKSLFPQSCVSSCGSMVGLMVTSSKRAYAIAMSAAPRAPAPAAVHCWPLPPQETPKHRYVSVSVGSLGPRAHKVCLSPLSISGRYGIWFWMWFCPLYHLSGASPSFALGQGISPQSRSSTAQPFYIIYILEDFSMILEDIL